MHDTHCSFRAGNAAFGTELLSFCVGKCKLDFSSDGGRVVVEQVWVVRESSHLGRTRRRVARGYVFQAFDDSLKNN